MKKLKYYIMMIFGFLCMILVIGFISKVRSEIYFVETIYEYPTEIKKEPLVIVKGFPEDSLATLINTRIYLKKGRDPVYTWKGENGSYKLDQQSKIIDKYGNRERSFGICQLNERRHYDFIHSEDFKDWKKQVDYCLGVWEDAERRNILKRTFTAYEHRELYKNDFTIIYR